MGIAKGPGGAYWMVQDEDGNVQSTHATKEEAEAAEGNPAPVPVEVEEAGVEELGRALAVLPAIGVTHDSLLHQAVHHQ